jgi:putative serine protease PepD
MKPMSAADRPGEPHTDAPPTEPVRSTEAIEPVTGEPRSLAQDVTEPAPGEPGSPAQDVTEPVGMVPPDGDRDRTVEQPWSSWSPWAPDADREPAPASVVPPAWPSPPPAPPARTEARRSGTGRAALVGGLAGALMAALVATGVTVALDDDDPSSSAGRPAATPVTASDGSLDIQGILTKVQPSVVAIETSTSTSRGVFEGAGSGIVISADGLVLTNAHVIGGLGDITVVLADGTERQAALVGSSPDDDIAVIQIDGAEDLEPAELGSSDDLRVGDEVIAIGNALNLGSEPTVTRGIVSATDRDLSAEGVQLEGLIQTDAAINPGNSGGPLVNTAGQVVGMNTAIVAEAQNLGFSIAIDRARPIIEQLKSGEGAINPDQAFLGVSSTNLDDLTDTVRERFDIAVDAGAFVTEVVPDSAADRAGLEVGDVITEIDGTAVEQSSDVRDVILEHEPGDTVELVVIREGEERAIEVELGRRGDGI